MCRSATAAQPFPDAKAQQTTALLDGGTAKAIGETTKFLKEQGEVGRCCRIIRRMSA
ncbi:hypothetical protein [Pseudomonas sp. HLT2-19-2]